MSNEKSWVSCDFTLKERPLIMEIRDMLIKLSDEVNQGSIRRCDAAFKLDAISVRISKVSNKISETK